MREFSDLDVTTTPNVFTGRPSGTLYVSSQSYEVLSRRGSLQTTREGNTSTNGPPSESQPTGVGGRPRRVSEEDDDSQGWTESPRA